MWSFDMATSQWARLDNPDSNGIIQNKDEPDIHIARSGHIAVDVNNKMYIFGGIFEVTKELNDMIIFDYTSK